MRQGLMRRMQAPHQHADEGLVEIVAVSGDKCSMVSGVKLTVVAASSTVTFALCRRRASLGAR